MGNPKCKLTILPLWDNFDGQFIALDHEENYRNGDKRFSLRRLLVFAAHSQRLFYEPRQSKKTKEQDMVTIMATRMAAAELTCVDEYYANKKWRAHMRESFLKNIANESLSFDPAELSESEVEETKADLFDELSHSNENLRLLRRDILSCWSKYNTEQEWKDIADFPELVSRWFKGQRYILFRYINGPSLSEIKETLGKFVSEEHQQLRVEERSLKFLIRETIAK